MKIMLVAQVENHKNLKRLLKKQTVQPDIVFIYTDPEPARGINLRRRRIVENHKKLVEAVEKEKPDLVWQVEGDCDLPENALETLLKDYKELKGKKFGYVSGTQVGRHGLYILGAWIFKPDLTEFKSLDHKLTGFQEVDATGFYCLLAPRKVWLEGVIDWEWQPYGPDVFWGLSLRDKGYKIYCDMDLKIGHIVKGGVIHPDNPSTENARFFKENNKWQYKTY